MCSVHSSSARVGDKKDPKKKGKGSQERTEEEEEQLRLTRLKQARAFLDTKYEFARLDGRRVNRDQFHTFFFFPKTPSLSRFHVDEQKTIVRGLKTFPNCKRPVRFASQVRWQQGLFFP